MPDGSITARRPGGRTGRTGDAVAHAVLTLIARGDLEFEIKEVAELSGVHRVTIFRRWPTRGALIAEALARHMAQLGFIATADWRADIRAMGFALRDFFADPIELAIIRSAAITDGAALLQLGHDQWWPVMRPFVQRLLDAQHAGEIDPVADVRVAVSMLNSTLLSETFFTRAPVADDDVVRLVDQIVRLCTCDRC